MMKKLINKILWLMLTIGGLGFLLIIASHALASFGAVALSSKVQLPLSIEYRKDMWVDSKGNIYTFIPSYSRIQTYNKEGDFSKGWFVKNIVTIYIDSNDVFHTVTLDDEHIIYNLNGEIITKEFVKDIYEKYNRLSKRKTDKDSDGFKYTYNGFPFETKIFKVSPAGERILLMKEPFCLWILKGPFPLAIYFIVPPAFWGITSVLHKRKQKNKQDCTNCSLQESDES